MRAKPWCRASVAAVVSVVWIVGFPVSSGAVSQPTVSLGVRGPVIRADAPDPSILVVGHTYDAFTTNAGGNNVPVYQSTDLVHWHLVGDAMPVLAAWASPGYSWSPSVTTSPGGGYELFYDAYDEADGDQCIGRASAPSPLGPFVDPSSEPFLCQKALGGSIDAAVFQRTGGDVLVWKSDRTSGIWAQQLTADDDGLIGSPHLLLTPTASWEHGVVEGPAMLQIGSTITLWFSAGGWSGAGYSIGMVTCSSPLGSCDASAATQEVKTGGTLLGPGSPTFFDVHGTVDMGFSAWVGDVRAMYLASVDTDSATASATEPSPSLAASRGTARSGGTSREHG